MDDIVAALRDGLRTSRDKTAELEAHAESPDRLVSATVGRQGELLLLELDPRSWVAVTRSSSAVSVDAASPDALGFGHTGQPARATAGEAPADS
ncbi:hypothetical protein AB0878_21325 [Amycolatopsis sp. NPDC047767]|uniref:hypothetical protein n=1 Tax=Amycolatopsis sp. NPDC047767 TaxID=3156765 RepID=UPI003453CF1E